MPTRAIYFAFSFLLLSIFTNAQISKNVNLLCNWQDTTHAPALPGGQHWNDCWGFVAHGKEYGVIGSTTGTHIIDIDNCKEQFYYPGASSGTIHRDFKTFGHYLYAVADEGHSTLQIFDFNYLPDSLHLVYESKQVDFQNAHNIFIDTAKAKLYCASAYSLGNGHRNLLVYSLQNPEHPVELGDVENYQNTQDVYARNDTAWCSNSNGGYLILDMNQLPNFTAIGGLTYYPYRGYNHSSWVGYDYIGVMADENFGMPLKVIDATNPSIIRVLSTFGPRGTDSTSIPHNPFLLGHYAFISYYLDGLQIYDLSDPTNPVAVGYYDTYPGPNEAKFLGAWGCFPYLPSGRILVSDMETGLYVLDAKAATPKLAVSNTYTTTSISLYPNPVENHLWLQFPWQLNGEITIDFINVIGQNTWHIAEVIKQQNNRTLEVSLPTDFASGIYMLRATIGGQYFNAHFTKR